MKRRGPLAGLRVIDASRVLAGPYLAMLLGDLGADVIKIEKPDGGDQTRGWGPPFVGPPEARVSAYFVSANRNKRSAVLDLKSPAGRRAFRKLLATADVLVENFLPGEWTKLGFRTSNFRRRNPRLVHASITGYGSGPDADRPAYDVILQAESGLMSLTGHGEGEPVRVGIAVIDFLSALYGLSGVLAALVERGVTGRGRRVEVSMIDAGTAFLSYAAQSWLADGRQPPPSARAIRTSRRTRPSPRGMAGSWSASAARTSGGASARRSAGRRSRTTRASQPTPTGSATGPGSTSSSPASSRSGPPRTGTWR